MKKILMSFIVSFMFLFTLLPPSTFALSCIIPIVSEVISKYDAVIVATVDDVNIKKLKRTRTVTATVNESYKGVTDKQITFTEDYEWGKSTKGQRIIYFLKKADNGSWELPLCADFILGIGYEYSQEIYDDLQEYTKLELIDTEIVDDVENNANQDNDADLNDASSVHVEGELYTEPLKAEEASQKYIPYVVISLIVFIILTLTIYEKIRQSEK